MTVAVLVQNMRIGGVARLITDELNEMHRRGIKVWLVVFELSDPQNTLVNAVQIPTEQIVYIRYERMRSVRGMYALVRCLRTIKPDVVFTHMWFANTVGRLAAWWTRVPRVFAFELSVYDLVKNKKQFFLDRLLQYCSTGVIAVSEGVRESLLAHGINPKNIVVVYNAANLKRYRVNTPRKDLRRKFGIPQDSFVCIFVGRLIGDKAVDVLLTALANVPGIRACIVGAGPEEESLKRQSAELGLEGRVQFLGSLVDVPELLHAADLLVLPSRREGLPLVVIEARAAGLPVVLADFPASAEVIDDGVQGLIVPRGDSEALAEALRTLSHDTGLYKKLAAAAPEGLERFSIERHVDQLMALAERPPAR